MRAVYGHGMKARNGTTFLNGQVAISSVQTTPEDN
jgi:hypothetical protein